MSHWPLKTTFYSFPALSITLHLPSLAVLWHTLVYSCTLHIISAMSIHPPHFPALAVHAPHTPAHSGLPSSIAEAFDTFTATGLSCPCHPCLVSCSHASSGAPGYFPMLPTCTRPCSHTLLSAPLVSPLHMVPLSVVFPAPDPCSWTP